MKWKDKLEDLFASAAFAEGGDVETAREVQGKRNVLLVIRGAESDRAPFKYALNICKRISAALEVIYSAPESQVRGMLKTVVGEAEKEGVPVRLVKKAGCIKKAVVEYTEDRSDIQFVVVKSHGDLDDDCNEKEVLRAWKSLDCPLVVVSEGLKA